MPAGGGLRKLGRAGSALARCYGSVEAFEPSAVSLRVLRGAGLSQEPIGNQEPERNDGQRADTEREACRKGAFNQRLAARGEQNQKQQSVERSDDANR